VTDRAGAAAIEGSTRRTRSGSGRADGAQVRSLTTTGAAARLERERCERAAQTPSHVRAHGAEQAGPFHRPSCRCAGADSSRRIGTQRLAHPARAHRRRRRSPGLRSRLALDTRLAVLHRGSLDRARSGRGDGPA